MRNLVLSKRMEAVVNMVSPQSFTVADIGCDHAYVSIALIQLQPARRVVAMDVREGPLEIAEKNVKIYGMEEKIELRLSDGLDKLGKGEADTIIIAGMGGLLIKSILEKGKNILSYREKSPVLILQPQSDVREVRIFLYEHAYHIVQEMILEEEGKYYTVIKAVPGEKKGCFFDAEWQYGKYNLECRNKVLYTYLQKEKQTLENILIRLRDTIEQTEKCGGTIPHKTLERMRSVEKELAVNASAMEYYINRQGGDR